MSCPPQAYIVGIRCAGDYCDSKRLRCQYLLEKDSPVGPPTLSWTSDFSEESGGYSEGNRPYPIQQVRCHGKKCDNLRLWQGKYGTSPDWMITATEADSYWTDWFSEESPSQLSCDEDHVVTRIRCGGSYCDNKRLQCSKINTGKAIMWGSEFQSQWAASDSGKSGYVSCGPEAYMTGMRCSGGHCSWIKLICRSVKHREMVTYAGWVQRFTVFGAQNTLSVQKCVTTQTTTTATETETNSLAESVTESTTTSSKVCASAGVRRLRSLLQSASIEACAEESNTLSYTTTSTVSSSISNSVSELVQYKTCETETVTCDFAKYSDYSELAMYQYVVYVVDKGLGDTIAAAPLAAYTSNWICRPSTSHGWGEPICPPGRADLSASDTYQVCLPGTFE